MKINITKQQYRELITLTSIGNGILGVLGDVLPDKDYKKRSNKTEELEKYFLQYADDFDCGDLVDEEMYEKNILPILTDYEEYSTHDNLSNELAWRDFRKEHSEAEIREKAKKNGGYFGVETYDYEKKYWDEFDKNGYDRLEINK